MKAQVISFRCVLRNKLGHFISDSYNDEVINQAEEGRDRLLGLVSGLQNVRPGEKRQIEVEAERAFGFYDPDLVMTVSRSELKQGDKLTFGSELDLYLPEKKRALRFRVVHASVDEVTLDGNHPLAGQDLIFEVEITEARDLGDGTKDPPRLVSRNLH